MMIKITFKHQSIIFTIISDSLFSIDHQYVRLSRIIMVQSFINLTKLGIIKEMETYITINKTLCDKTFTSPNKKKV